MLLMKAIIQTVVLLNIVINIISNVSGQDYKTSKHNSKNNVRAKVKTKIITVKHNEGVLRGYIYIQLLRIIIDREKRVDVSLIHFLTYLMDCS